MKKIFNFLFFLGMLGAFTTCTSEVDDCFDKSSAERIEEAIKTDMQILTSAAKGWHVIYYADTQYGGYHMFWKFNNDSTVSICSEAGDGINATTSHFKIVQSQGVLLSFDEFNDQMHFFSDPVNPAGIGDDGKGMNGDFEFRVIECRNDSVIMRGKKHDAKIVMTPVAADFDLEEYLAAVWEHESHLTKRYALTIGDKEYLTTCSFRQFSITDPETGEVTDAPFIVTDKTLKFYSPITLNGHTMTELAFTGENWTDVSDPSIVLIPVIPPLTDQLQEGAWYFKKSDISAKALPYFNVAVQGSASEGEEIGIMYLGPANLIKQFISVDFTSAYALTFISLNSMNAYEGALNYDVAVIDEETVKLTFAGFAQGYGAYYYNNCGYDYVAFIIGGTSKNYKLTTDNINAPTWIKMQNVEDPGIYWTLYASPVIYPFR